MDLTKFPGDTGAKPLKMIFVHYSHYKIRLLEGYAKLKGLKNGDVILSEDEFWDIINGNADYGKQELSK
jgi:hypothetical protein